MFCKTSKEKKTSITKQNIEAVEDCRKETKCYLGYPCAACYLARARLGPRKAPLAFWDSTCRTELFYVAMPKLRYFRQWRCVFVFSLEFNQPGDVNRKVLVPSCQVRKSQYLTAGLGFSLSARRQQSVRRRRIRRTMTSNAQEIDLV